MNDRLPRPVLLTSFCMVAIMAHAQNLPTHELLITADAVNTKQLPDTPRATATLVNVDGQPFNKAIRIANHEPMKRFYDFQIDFRTPVALSKGDVLLVTFYARGEAPANESGEADGQVYFQKHSPNWQKYLTTHFSAGAAWKRFDYPLTVPAKYAAQTTALCFGTGFNKQVLELGGITLRRFARGTPLHTLPRTAIEYPGSEPDAPWRAAAAERIEKHRKGTLTVKVVDRAGRPCPNAEVSAQMTRHAFRFSSVIKASLITEQTPNAQTYRKKVLELFNASGTENALKWPPWESQWGKSYSQENTLNALKWLKGHGLHLRGHVMVWPSWRHLPKRVRAMKDNPEELRAAVLEHIADIAAKTEPYLDEWDVINETRTNHDLMDLLGRDVMVDWFAKARECLPNTKLYINDFSILNGQGPGSNVHDTYKNTIRFLLDRGAPIDGIGLQGHLGGYLNHPAKVLRILDDMATLGLDIRVTEFDINIQDETAQANYTRDFMTILFSHPSVVGFQMWGFWEGAHWRPAGAMYRRNWEEKPNAKAYKDLVFKTWWTKELQGRTNTGGLFEDRGFLGSYTVTVKTGDTVKTVNANLDRRPETIQIIVD